MCVHRHTIAARAHAGAVLGAILWDMSFPKVGLWAEPDLWPSHALPTEAALITTGSNAWHLCQAATLELDALKQAAPLLDMGAPLLYMLGLGLRPLLDMGAPLLDMGAPLLDMGAPLLDMGAPAPLLGHAGRQQCRGGALGGTIETPLHAPALCRVQPSSWA